ncbi:MAG: AAA family ATPase [Lachnospiraceae bacterium]|nr:AAA family ATPase [Lachnospiraceae bacterium]
MPDCVVGGFFNPFNCRFIDSVFLAWYDDELRGMVGLKEAKDQIERFIATARMNRLIGRESLGGNHLLFLGNAGIGKTTVAKLYSRMLYSLELTRSPKTVCITSHELFSTYQGESAKKLRDFCSKAMGGVIFIDEAIFEVLAYMFALGCPIGGIICPVKLSAKKDYKPVSYRISHYEGAEFFVAGLPTNCPSGFPADFKEYKRIMRDREKILWEAIIGKEKT